jgi:type I restriction enzyme, S subunit
VNQNKTRFKPSGIEWLGEVPEHWKVCKIKRLSPVKRGASPRPIDDLKYFDDDGEFSWVRISDVTASKKYLTQTTEKLSALGSSLSVKLDPDTFFVSIAASVGKPAITKIKCCIHDGFVYLPYLKINPEFLYYLFEGGQLFQGLGKLGTQLNLNTETIGSIHIPIPPEDEIKSITDYIDRETTEIDALVAEKEHMLALIEEKREALISHAVTHGLNPNAPMKPSGLDWLSEIPQHWKIGQLKRLWKSDDYGISENIRGEGEIKVLRMTCIDNGIVDLTKGGEVESVDPYLFLEKGDLLFNRTNSLDQVAKVGIVQSTPDRPTSFASYLVRIRTNELVYPEFLAAYLNSQEFLTFARKNAIPAIGQANLSPSRYGEIKIAIPPKSEQREIVDTIEKEKEKTRELIIELTDSITLLKERRSALITAAVTGQIEPEDMRG